jgi:cyclopropane-fatty-acyl-phospholipid synthase
MTSTSTPTGAMPNLPSKVEVVALRIFDRLMQGYPGNAALRLWDNTRHALGQAAPAFTLVLRDPGLLRQLVLKPNPLLLAQAYFDNLLDVEGDIYEVLSLKHHFEHLQLGWRERIQLWLDAQTLPKPLGQTPANIKAGHQRTQHFDHQHTHASDQAAIAFHYDVSNEFYGLWLDEARVYSCAYFHSPQDSLDQAQRNKLEHICRKLRLQPGQTLLDIGCGWGALVCWAAKHHGVRAHGITLSQEQLAYAQERIVQEGLQGRVTVALCDYRDLPAQSRFDRVSSVGMFEHVGLANLPKYHAQVFDLLKPGGLFLNHGITHNEEGWQRNVDTEFINRFVFPDGELDRVSNIALGMERAGFEMLDIEALRPHYAMTLRHWVTRLEAQRDKAVALVGERTYRVWRLYMAACALEFEAGGTGLHQILAAKPDHGAWRVPLTRQDLYDSNALNVPIAGTKPAN